MGRIICILTFLLMTCSALAQKEVTGRLTDKQTGEALVGANVMVKNAEGKLVKFATTREDGTFLIKLSAWNQGMTIHVSMIGMKTYTAPLSEEMTKLDIRMEEDTQELKEVIVKAGRIRESGDTVTYRVSGFAQKQDRSIGDVLQRMPGIDVASNGKIQYQGVDINKFYIEGSDLLEGKYGIATNGISHDAIGAVEVLENHQPMQVLSGLSFSDQAAINLKLKDKAKATWLLNGHIGGGWSNQPKEGLWNGEAFLMAVMANYQTITTVKSNNTGMDLRNQVIDFLSGGRGTNLGDYFSVQLPSTPNLSRDRTTFNRSWMLSSSHLWKVKKGEMKAQIDYYNHRATASSASTSTYYLDNREKMIHESREGTEHGKQLTGKFIIEANEKTHYLNNTLQTELNWDDIRTSMTGTLPNSQYAKMPDYYVANRLQVIKRFGGKHLVTFSSVNEWESKPQRLSVEYPDESRFSQRISNHAFYTNERASYGFYLKGFNLSLEGGIQGYLRDMESNLEDAINGNTIGDVTTNYLSLYASPKLEYAFKKVELTLQYPFNYTLYKFNGRIGNQSEYFHSPLLKVRWSPNPRFSVTVTGGLGRSPMSLQNIHDEAILSDYRTFTQGVEDFYTNSRKQVSGRVQYRDTPRGFFANAILIKSWSNTPYKTTQHFVDDFIFHSYEASPSRSQSLNIMGNVNKTLDFMRGSIAVNGGYSRMANNMVSENVPTLYHNTTWNLGGRINGSLSNYVYWSYNIKYSNSQLSMNREEMQNLDRYTHSFSLNISPIDVLSWETEGEYYRNEVAEGNYKNLFLLDTKLTWQISKRMELMASVNNLFNRKEYTYTTYNNLSSIESTRYLRGREFMFTIYLKK
ncbi:MAG: TonB-dependent receptor [Bacteroidaceae bacterium]|nr:TonB-dependent receptor [Bacteroidaceae bacterium]